MRRLQVSQTPLLRNLVGIGLAHRLPSLGLAEVALAGLGLVLQLKKAVPPDAHALHDVILVCGRRIVGLEDLFLEGQESRGGVYCHSGQRKGHADRSPTSDRRSGLGDEGST